MRKSVEMIDVLNETGEIIDTIPRTQAEQENHITENVLVFLFNSLGRVWVQLRPEWKNHFGGLWDISACGGIMSGESREQAASRETAEETGIVVQLHHVESFLNVFPGDNGEIRKRLSHLFIGISDEVPEANDEVDDFKNWDPNELQSDVQKNSVLYVPSFGIELEKAVLAYNSLRDQIL